MRETRTPPGHPPRPPALTSDDGKGTEEEGDLGRCGQVAVKRPVAQRRGLRHGLRGGLGAHAGGGLGQDELGRRHLERTQASDGCTRKEEAGELRVPGLHTHHHRRPRTCNGRLAERLDRRRLSQRRVEDAVRRHACCLCSISQEC